MKEIKCIALSILVIIIVGLGAKLFIQSEKPSKVLRVERVLSDSKEYKIKSPILPAKLDFCGEGVPLDTFYVREQLDREIIINTYWHSSTLFLFKRANRWLPVIEPILLKYGIPNDLKYIALIESNLKNVVSPSGARGFWQLMRRTAIDQGLEITKEVDQRYDVELSTEAACKYLKSAYRQLGSWTLVAAAYNMGVVGLNNRLTEQKANCYYDLLLNEETSRYIYRLLAMKVIFANPSEYGFELTKSDLYPPLKYRNIEVNNSVANWADFAQEHGVSYRLLKLYNPWLRTRNFRNVYKRSYNIKLPDSEMIKHSSMHLKTDDKSLVLEDK